MTLKIITSRSKEQTTAYIHREIKEKLLENPTGKPILYIVPEQMTFQQEYELFNNDHIKGSIRAQVVSFSRLAWRVLQETGGATKKFISSTGIQMMLRKIVDNRSEPFNVFQKAKDKQGFIAEMEGLVTEFKRHMITPAMLYEHLNYTQENIAFNNKLADIHYIYQELTNQLQHQYIDGEDQLQMLIDKIPETSFLENAEVYIDGFYGLTPKELTIITELLKVTKSITVSLITDQIQVMEEVTELDLFYQTTATYHTLRQVAEEANVRVDSPLFINEQGNKVPALQHLQRNFTEQPAPQFQPNVEGAIKLVEAVHPRAEIEGVIQEILKLVREENYRYRDIVLYIRDQDTYNPLIKTLFADYHLPVFIDEKRPMLYHPLVEFVRSFFELIESNWRSDALFRLLKTGFIKASDETHPLDSDAINLLENYVIEYGIRNKSQWTETEKWKYQRFYGFDQAPQTTREQLLEEKINVYRDQVVEALLPFDKQIRKVKSVKERCEIIFMMLETLNIPEQLEQRKFTFDEQGDIERAREEDQVWQGLIDLLDELVEMIGEDLIAFPLFKRTFEAGLEALEFSHVPPSIDHIIVANIDHSRIDSKPCAFLLGVNEGFWPMKPALDGIINEEEREYLIQFGLQLADSSRRVLLDDTFYMYLAFTTATDLMWVSYPISDGDGAAKIASQMIRRLQEFFPSLSEVALLTDPDELQDANRFITTREQTRGPLAVQLARYLRGYKMDETWWSVLNWYMENEAKHETTYQVLQSLFYMNEPVNLSEATVKKLIPNEIEASVSRMEMYYRCSYQHFLEYNLKLKERQVYSLDAPDIGLLFHEALKKITEWVQAEKTDFARLTKESAHQYAERSMSHLAPILQHQILSSSYRFQYIKQKLQDVIAQATFILSEQARESGFSPVGIELGFGFTEGLAPVMIELPNGYQLKLRGRIDRVDKAIANEQLYLRIIDYKSSARGLDLLEVYYGLALQMLTYLDVILSQSKDWLGSTASPAGVLYFHVHNAMLQEEEQLDEAEIFDKLFKKYKMTGLVTADKQIAQLMDVSMEKGRSDIVPVGIKADGTFYADSKVADQHTFDILREHIRRLIVEAGIEMTTGKIELNPFENKDRTACQFCKFKAVCQFDPILKENNYRPLKVYKDDEIIKRLREETEIE